jgi:prophage maintenance system killer protein
MESLANNRPFLNGNKRVAFAAAHTFLLINGFDLAVDSHAAFEFIMLPLSFLRDGMGVPASANRPPALRARMRPAAISFLTILHSIRRAHRR